MRQIFSSQRVENVEQVAALMREHGIEVQITNGRGYMSGRRRTFSYRDSANRRNMPAVWVVRADDQVRARELMKELGMPDRPTTRPVTDSYLASSSVPGLAPEAPVVSPARQRIMRYRRILLVVIAILAALVLVRTFSAG